MSLPSTRTKSLKSRFSRIMTTLDQEQVCKADPRSVSTLTQLLTHTSVSGRCVRAGRVGGSQHGQGRQQQFCARQPDPSRAPFSHPGPPQNGQPLSRVDTRVSKVEGDFISCPSLWTSLGCVGLEKTRVYLERSKGSPLEVRFLEGASPPSRADAFLLALPHISRLKTLTLSGTLDSTELTKRLTSPAPLLEKLELFMWHAHSAAINGALFDGDFRSLRELFLIGVTTDLPWRDLLNLQTFTFFPPSDNKIPVTLLLDFFERAPRLCEIKLMDSVLDSSDAPAQRVVSLPRLRLFFISAETPPTILLNHVHIPIGASVTLEFHYNRVRSPFMGNLLRSPNNLGNISHVTSVNPQRLPRGGPAA